MNIRRLRTGATIAALPVVAATLMMALPGQAFAATQSNCGVSSKLDWGRAVATSNCTPVFGPMVKGAKMVNQHRAVITCDNIRGQGNQHDIRVTLYGDWKNPGQTSSVTCPIRSSLVGYSQQTN
ncbi:hypothetical protein [Kitasatospora mediocidica]|uniref:hypothetical protein n=1 Tax=Kitasatospora mediocidica TaxID=58352 RepID=UPI0005613B97|nr:hypothetical protein [Kitasatospora mediocidica]